MGSQKRLVAALLAVVAVVGAALVFPGFRAGLRAAARATGFAAAPRPVRTGERFPALAFSDLDGKAVVTANPPSGIVVYNVFATWCVPCREETPELRRAAAEFAKRGIRVVGIDQGEPSGAVAAFAQEFGLGYPLLVDTTHQTSQVLGARVIPETIVVRDGIVRSISVGPMTSSDFERVVSQSNAS